MGKVLGAVALALGALAGCAFNAPSPEGTSYACAPDGTCPDGFACVGNVCRAGPAIADASTSIDAALIDAAPPADAGPTTLTFGERPAAAIHDVATDVNITSEDLTLNPFEVLIHGRPAEVAGLMAFDLSAIPRRATVLSVDLTLYVLDPYRPYSGESTTAQVLTVPWDEATATWTQASTGVPWPADGALGSSVGATLVSRFAPQVDQEYVMPLAVAPVQAWVSDPSSNHGMRWRSDTTSSNNLRWRSSEHELNPESRPMLRVTFQP